MGIPVSKLAAFNSERSRDGIYYWYLRVIYSPGHVLEAVGTENKKCFVRRPCLESLVHSGLLADLLFVFLQLFLAQVIVWWLRQERWFCRRNAPFCEQAFESAQRKAPCSASLQSDPDMHILGEKQERR